MSRDMGPRVGLLVLVVCLGALRARGQTVATPLNAAAGLKLYTTTHSAMGTTFMLYLYSADAARAATVSDEVFEQIDASEQELSNYRESSELSRINKNAASGPVTTDAETMDFLVQAEHWSRASDGAFDMTVGTLMKAWGFYRHEGKVPPKSELARVRTVTGWEKVRLDPKARTVSFSTPGVELDPGGIGKGFAVDAVVRILRADQVSAALISAGTSTLYALGSPPGRKGWRVVVPGPLPYKGALSVVTLRDTSLSSADCSQKNFTVDGHLYCHIMDPKTLRPVEGRVQVSIIDPSATASDALSNVIFVETPEESRTTLKRYAPEARAIIVSGDAGRARCAMFRWGAAVDTRRCPVR